MRMRMLEGTFSLDAAKIKSTELPLRIMYPFTLRPFSPVPCDLSIFYHRNPGISNDIIDDPIWAYAAGI